MTCRFVTCIIVTIIHFERGGQSIDYLFIFRY